MKTFKRSVIAPICVGIFCSLVIVVFRMYIGGYLGDNVYIEQKVGINSVLGDTYFVQTCVWINYNGELAIEKSYNNSDITCDQIPIIKQTQMEQAQIVMGLVKERLKTFKLCDKLD